MRTSLSGRSRLLPVLTLVLTALVASAVPALGAPSEGDAVARFGASVLEEAGAPPLKVLRASDVVAPPRLRARANLVRPEDPVTAPFSVSYTGFSTEQRASFQHAVDIWSRILVSDVPIHVDATLSRLEPGVLGAAGPGNAFRTTGADPSYFAVALANSIVGRDLDPERPDIVAEFSDDPGLVYFGTDGRPPTGTFDFPTIVLHEIGHGIGFFGGLEVVNDRGTYDPGSAEPTPFIYDRFTVQETGTSFRPLLDYPRDSVELAAALQSNAVFWDGDNGVAAAGGALPRLYAPPRWEPGSSYSHLDEVSYPPGTTNALMTPFAARQEVLRDPGPISLGILEDQGWRLSQASDPTPPPSAQPSVSPSPTPEATSAPMPAMTFEPTPNPTPASAPGGSRYTPVDPRRLLDTRDGTGAPTGRVPAGGSVRLVVAGGGTGVPAGATAVVLNVTGVAATRPTDVRVFPATSGGAVPSVSNLNLAAGQTRANLVTVAVGEQGAVRLRNQSGDVHLLADLAGYYLPQAASGFFPLEPTRVLDTRTGVGSSPGARLPAGGTLDLQVAGTREVPTTAQAVVLSVTAVGATRSTDVRVYPRRAASAAVPTISNLNVVPGGAVPNLVIVRVGDDGLVRLRNNAGELSLVADVFGYYDAGSGGALFRPLAPERLLDTRPARLGERELLDLDTSERGGVPEGATAVALNLTGVAASASTDIRVYPTPLGRTGDGPPSVSTLNLTRGQTAAAAAIVPTGNGGMVRFYNNSGSVALLADVAGWFGP